MHQYLDEHQIKAVEALFELKRICDKHDIHFYLLAGTTLGAVRHEGMIPWDDDVDVGLLLDDLRKLQAVIADELDPSLGFEYVSLETEPGFPRLFGKILYNRQSCVDLFLIAKWTTNDFSGAIHWNITRFCVESYYRSIGYAKPRVSKNADVTGQPVSSSAQKDMLITRVLRKLKRIARKATKPYHIKKAIRTIIYKCCFFLKTEDYIRLARWNEDYFGRKGYDCYANLYSIYGMRKERIKKEWIENTSYVTFEGEQFMTVGDTDAYLRHLYGDYMQLPPEEKRVRARHAEVYERTK